MSNESPRVAVVGAGQTGRGWCTLLAAAGWPVTLYDASTSVGLAAEEEVRDRVRSVVRRGLASDGTATGGLAALAIGRSLLQAVQEADWILEAGPDDLAVKQKLLEQVEQVARAGVVLASTSGALQPSALCARLRRPERLLVVHAMTPVELFPVVEIVPGPHTDPEATTQVRYWLRKLHRVPIVLSREVPGGLLGRMRAAVWREAIQLVLDGVAAPEEIDLAMQQGPALWWASAGPHLRAVLGAGPGADEEELQMHLSTLLGALEPTWGGLATWTRLDEQARHRLVRALVRAYADRPLSAGTAADDTTVAFLNALRRLE